MTGQDWRVRAACRDVTPDLFFPRVSPYGPRLQVPADDHAKAICATCPVVNDCLTYAVSTKQEDGIWGGATPQERRRIRLLRLRDAR